LKENEELITDERDKFLKGSNIRKVVSLRGQLVVKVAVITRQIRTLSSSWMDYCCEARGAAVSMVTAIVIKGFIAFIVCVAVLVTNIPVIAMSRRSDHLKDDIVGKVMVSLCFADIAVGAVPSAISATLAWLQPGSVPAALCAFQVSRPTEWWHTKMYIWIGTAQEIQERTRSTKSKLEGRSQQRPTKDGVHLGGSRGGSS